MERITKPNVREIIEDFAREISSRQTRGPRPTKAVIDFRNERRDGKERDVLYVPIELLRYRKDNGRISSDVLHYEKNQRLLHERRDKAQEIIESFLSEKDEKKTEELTDSIKHEGQRDPAIITCDGFLINGNRRKMVLESLLKKYPGDQRFQLMKVVILPGKGEEGGPPTLLQIEQIENRYQLQSDGKAEYYAFDKAISVRRKINLGMRLEEQLRDDPVYAGKDEKKFQESVRKFEADYLQPLRCIDRYLEYLGREGLYSTVSKGLGDPEGRWQAFLDYYKFVYRRLSDERKRSNLGIREDQVGDIEDVAFKIIRMRELRELPGLTKVHQVMRQFPKWLGEEDSRNELLQLLDVDLKLSESERVDAEGKEHDHGDLDSIWRRKNRELIIRQIKRAMDSFEHRRERETPKALLEAALKKLNHACMNTKTVRHSDIPKAMQLTKRIQKRASEIESELYRHDKELKKLNRRVK
ncbi:MAG: hypothetical protein WBD64_03105 [Candidatus Zixiibacteriota bacterium]